MVRRFLISPLFLSWRWILSFFIRSRICSYVLEEWKAAALFRLIWIKLFYISLILYSKSLLSPFINLQFFPTPSISLRYRAVSALFALISSMSSQQDFFNCKRWSSRPVFSWQLYGISGSVYAGTLFLMNFFTCPFLSLGNEYLIALIRLILRALWEVGLNPKPSFCEEADESMPEIEE